MLCQIIDEPGVLFGFTFGQAIDIFAGIGNSDCSHRRKRLLQHAVGVEPMRIGSLDIRSRIFFYEISLPLVQASKQSGQQFN